MKRSLQELRLALWSYWHVQHAGEGGIRLQGAPGDRYYRCIACGGTCPRPEARR